MADVTYTASTFSSSGSSASDRAKVDDILAASGNPFDDVLPTVGLTSAQEHELALDGDDFWDLTGAEFLMRNGAHDQALQLELDGDVLVRNQDNNPELRHRDCVIQFGPYDMQTTHLNIVNLMTAAAKIVCEEGSRIVYKHHHTETARSDEPGSRTGLRVRNNNADSELRVAIESGPAIDADWELQANEKPNGAEIVHWDVRSAVAIREFDWRSGYCDFRPANTSAPPTRGVFRSRSGVKFLGTGNNFTVSAPLIYGNANDAFEITQRADRYWLFGIVGTTSGTNSDYRVVVLNLAGPDLEARFAMYSGGANAGRFENHLVLDYKIIDGAGDPIEDAEVRVHARTPSYSAPAASGNPSVSFPSANAVILSSRADADGEGSIGTTDGDLDTALCIEAFGRRIRSNGGDTDSAYSSAADSRSDYASHASLTYDVLAFGYTPVIGSSFTAKKSGEDGHGKQGFGAIGLVADGNVSSETAGDVPFAAGDFNDIYDMLHKYAIENREDMVVSVAGGIMDFGSSDITLQGPQLLVLQDDGSTARIFEIYPDEVDSSGVIEGTDLGAFASGLANPTGLGWGDGRWLVVDSSGDDLWRVNPNDPDSTSGDYGDQGALPGFLTTPLGITYADDNGWLVVDDDGNELWRVDPADPDNTAGDYGNIGGLPLNLTSPVGIAWGDGKLLVVDSADADIWSINPDDPDDESGDYGNLGALPSQLQDPAGITYADGKWYVVDSFDNKLWHINPDDPDDESGDYGEVGTLPSGLSTATGIGYGYAVLTPTQIPCEKELDAGDNIASIVTSGTFTISRMRVTGPYEDTDGVVVVFDGLPADHQGVVRAWPKSQGLSDRSNEVSGSLGVDDATNTSIAITMDADTEYYYVADAKRYRRGPVGVVDTGSQTSVAISLERIVNAQGQELIPSALTTAEQAQADLIDWDADFITVDADGVNDEISYNALVYAVEESQSTVEACGSLLNPARIEAGRIVFPATSDQKWRAKSSLTDSTKVPDLQSTAIFKDGSEDAEDFVDFSNGPLKYKAEAPVFATITGTTEENIHSYLDDYPDKDAWKADVSAIPTDHMPQATFDDRVANVPSDTKDMYKGSGGSSSYSEANLHAHLNSYADKDDWKADASALSDGDHGLAALKTLLDTVSGHTDILDDGTNGLANLKTLLDTISGHTDIISGHTDILDDGTNGLAAIRTLVDAVPTDNPSVTDIVTGMQTADFEEGSGTRTLLQMVDAILTAVGAIPTSNPSAAAIAAEVGSSTIGTEVTAIKDLTEDSTHGLAALKALIDTVDAVADANKALLEDGDSGLVNLKALLDTISDYADILDDNAAGLLALKTLIETVDTVVDANKALLEDGTSGLAAIKTSVDALPATTDVVTAMQAADFDEGSGTRTLLQVLSALGSAIQAIPTSNPTAAQIATAIEDGAVGSNLTNIKQSIDHGTYGLDALRTLIQTVDTVVDSNKATLEDNQHGLSALRTLIRTVDTVVDSNKATLESDEHGMRALKTLIETVDTVADANKALLENGTYGLEQLKTLIETVDTVVDTNKATLEDTDHGLAHIIGTIDTMDTLLKTLPTSTLSRDDVDNVVKDLVVETGGITLKLALRILLGVAGARVQSHPNKYDVYSFVTDEYLASIPKFSRNSRPSGASTDDEG